MYQYTYTDTDLGRIHAICREYDDAYVMFNNFSMHPDAVRFRSLVRDQADAAVPAHE